MNTKVAALQTWLNAEGLNPPLVVDGQGGARTRNAVISMFANPNPKAVTEVELQSFASRLGCSVRQIKAVAEVESGGSGFLNSGQPKILWERHYFWKRLNIRIPLISDPAPGGYTRCIAHGMTRHRSGLLHRPRLGRRERELG